MEPKVSAIITTYNYGRFISDAIKCVLEQTRRPDEIIVVDDGSTDNTQEIVAGFAEQGVRYLYKQNGGAGSSRNAGVRSSSGDLIAFLDADDRWTPNKIQLQLDHLVRYPKVGLITGSEWQINEALGEKELYERKQLGSAKLYKQVLVENIIGNPSVTLIKRECFDKVGLFDEGMRLGQDWDMWIRILRYFPVGIVAQPVLLFYFHAGSLTSGQVDGRLASNLKIRQKYIAPLRAPFLRWRLNMAATSMSYFYAAAAISESPDKAAQARRFATLGLALDPTYQTRLKAALFFRVLFGRGAFNKVRDLTKQLTAAKK